MLCVEKGGARPVAPMARLVKGRLSDAGGPNLWLGGLRASQPQASGGTSTLQSRASCLQGTTQGNPIRTTRRFLRVKNNKGERGGARGLLRWHCVGYIYIYIYMYICTIYIYIYV